MRFGLVVSGLDGERPLDDLIAQATAAERAGFDLIWLTESAALPAPAIAAAALAPHLSSLHVGISVTAGVNPVYLAEEAAVADLCLGGRLVFAVGSDESSLLAETADVLLAGTAARPFRHEGRRWRIPANLPSNRMNRADRVRITPATAQLELPIWLTGGPAAQIGRERCLTFVGDGATDRLAAEWQHTEARLGPASNRLRRVAVRAVATSPDGDVDDAALVDGLRADQRTWGLDVALLRLPMLPAPERERAIGVLAARALPRLQLDRLPPGLEAYWRRRQEAAT